MVESELQRLREENGEMKKQLSDMAGLDDKRKKAEQKASDLESKVSNIQFSECIDLFVLGSTEGEKKVASTRG